MRGGSVVRAVPVGTRTHAEGKPCAGPQPRRMRVTLSRARRRAPRTSAPLLSLPAAGTASRDRRPADREPATVGPRAVDATRPDWRQRCGADQTRTARPQTDPRPTLWPSRVTVAMREGERSAGRARPPLVLHVRTSSTAEDRLVFAWHQARVAHERAPPPMPGGSQLERTPRNRCAPSSTGVRVMMRRRGAQPRRLPRARLRRPRQRVAARVRPRRART